MLLQALLAALGLGPYVALAGGIAQWARLTAAGLPAEEVLSVTDPGALLASGYRVLVVLPLTYVVVRICLRVAESIRESPREPALAVAVRRGWRIGSRVALVGVAATIALVLTLVLVSLAAIIAGGSAVAVAAASAGVAVCAGAVAWSLGRGVSRLTSTWRALPQGREPGERERMVAPVLRIAVTRVLQPVGRGAAATALVLVAGCAAVFAVASRGGPPWAVYAVVAILWLLLTAAVVLVGGAVVLRTAVARDLHPVSDAEERARFSVLAVAFVAVALFALPLALGAFVAVMVLATLLVEDLPFSLPIRTIALSMALALAFMGLQAGAPQRFDLLEMTVPAAGGEGSLAMRVAVVGSSDDAWLVAACDARPAEVLGWRVRVSTHPGLLRLAKGDGADAVITSGRYAFLPGDEPSLGGAILSILSDALRAPPLLSSSSLGRIFAAESVEADVCGGPRGSVARARAALRALAERRR